MVGILGGPSVSGLMDISSFISSSAKENQDGVDLLTYEFARIVIGIQVLVRCGGGMNVMSSGLWNLFAKEVRATTLAFASYPPGSGDVGVVVACCCFHEIFTANLICLQLT